MNTYKISYKWDEESFVTASKIAYEYSLKHSSKRFWGWFFIMLSQFGVVAAFKKGAFGLLFISTFLLIYWYLLRWPIRAFIIKREFKKSGLKDKEFIVSFNDDYIEINGVKINWSDIKSIASIKNGYLLEIPPQMLFLPKSAFKQKEAKEYFIKLAKSKSSFKQES